MKSLVFALVLPLCAAACGSGDTVGLHIQHAADGSAEIWTRSLMRQTGAGPVEGQAVAAQWLERARMVSSHGKVAKLDDLQLAGIRFSVTPGRLRVTVPCGPDAEWVDLFVPAPEDSEAALESYDPRDEQPGLGDRVVFEVALPGEVVSSGALPTVGTRSDHDRRSAMLEIAVNGARQRPREIVWDVTWR